MSEQSQVDLDLGDEEEVVVDLEENQAEQEEAPEASVSDTDDQFEQAESATQKRINRLTKKMRESERQQEAALTYAQQVQQENEQLKTRLNTMDTNYVDEYAGRVESQQQPKRPDPKAEEWAARNEWFGQNEAKTYAAFGIHKRLVEQEGFDPTSDEYYTELDRQIEETFPSANNEETSTRKRPAQTVAGATRTKKTGRGGKQVRLTPSEVAIAKKLGVPTAEYAKYVKR